MLRVSFQPRDAVFTLVNLPFLVKERAVNGGEKCVAETVQSVIITRTITSLFRLAKLCLNDVRVNNTPYKQTIVSSVWPRNHRDEDASR